MTDGNRCPVCGEYSLMGDDYRTVRYEEQGQTWFFCGPEHRVMWILRGGPKQERR